MLGALGKGISIIGRVLLLCLAASAAWARPPLARITTEIDNTDRVIVRGSEPRVASQSNDIGRMSSSTRLRGMSIVLTRSAAQRADLRSLIAAQQDPASPQYHQWLTPEAFAARFGAADADIATISWWLTQRGFSVESVSRSRNRITFSGTVGQVDTAFDTALHYFKVGGEKHFAPSRAISVPAALSSVVEAVTNLSDLRPKPRMRFGPRQATLDPRFTSSQTGNHFLSPADVATIYDIKPAYDAGYSGAGQSIAVVGQSSIVLSDIEHFQSAAGLPVKAPTLILVPGSGSASISSGDEAESDLDIEYTGGIAPGATIYFVYVGNSPGYGVWDSINYAIDNRTAPIISVSYGACEPALPTSTYASRNSMLAQAAAQGQSVIVAAGDTGSTDCAAQPGLSTSQQQALAVDFPASSQYVTGMGGTEFSASDTAASNTAYWATAVGTDVVSSALSYIPETVWNDSSSTAGLAAGGGGVSLLTARPDWQTGVPGIDTGSFRLVPDLSVASSSQNAGYLYCSSDTATGISGSCANGFRDSNNLYLTISGGTSVGAPVFAGMLAMVNERLKSTGQGVVNPILYTLAADSATYASAFHDITSGGNQCTAGPSYCSSAGTSAYAATVGYDEASGLGSVDFYNLLMAWPGSSASLAPSLTRLAAATATPGTGAADAITITVSASSGTGAGLPTGTVDITVDGTASGSLPLSNGTATYQFSSAAPGSHVIEANYSGDVNYASSTGTVSVIVSKPTFSVTATNSVIAAGNTGTSLVTVTPKSGYTGTITWHVASSPSIANACLSLPNTVVSGTSVVAATLTIQTSASSCPQLALMGPYNNRATPDGTRGGPLGPAWLLLFGLLGVRDRRHGGIPRLLSVIVLGAMLSGCGSGGSGGTPVAAKGTYTVTITGTDTATTTITASTSLTLTID